MALWPRRLLWVGTHLFSLEGLIRLPQQQTSRAFLGPHPKDALVPALRAWCPAPHVLLVTSSRPCFRTQRGFCCLRPQSPHGAATIFFTRDRFSESVVPGGPFLARGGRTEPLQGPAGPRGSGEHGELQKHHGDLRGPGDRPAGASSWPRHVDADCGSVPVPETSRRQPSPCSSTHAPWRPVSRAGQAVPRVSTRSSQDGGKGGGGCAQKHGHEQGSVLSSGANVSQMYFHRDGCLQGGLESRHWWVSLPTSTA